MSTGLQATTRLDSLDAKAVFGVGPDVLAVLGGAAGWPTLGDLAELAKVEPAARKKCIGEKHMALKKSMEAGKRLCGAASIETLAASVRGALESAADGGAAGADEGADEGGDDGADNGGADDGVADDGGADADADNGRELASDDEDDLCEEELELMDQIETEIETELDADEDQDED